MSACWCGASPLDPYHAGYLRCGACGTLVSSLPAAQAPHAPAPAQLDAASLDWISAVVPYLRPGARLFAANAGPGAVEFLRLCGFTLLESPAPGGLDGVLLIDVLEAEPDPVACLQRYAALLAPGGLIAVRTPEYPDPQSHASLSSAEHRFLEHLGAPAPRFLFSRRGATQLLRNSGLGDVEHLCLPAPPASMLLLAGQLHKASASDLERALSHLPQGAMALALLDSHRLSRHWQIQHRSAATQLRACLDARQPHLARESAAAAAFEELKTNLQASRDLSSSLAAALKRQSLEIIRWRRSQKATATSAHIAVDLTPVLPGGDNGGAKVLALELVSAMARLRPGFRFTLLTSARSHAEISRLEAPNIGTLCVHTHVPGPLPARAIDAARHRLAGSRLRRWVPLANSPFHAGKLGADLLFNPFTAPFYAHHSTPCVSIVHDLQFFDYPDLFTQAERQERERHFFEACLASQRLICGSEFVRRTILHRAGPSAPPIHVIHPTVHKRRPEAPAPAIAAALASHALTPLGFVFFPANYWPHKNHEFLLTALGIYLSRHPIPALKLVLTGAPGERAAAIAASARQMGLGDFVVQAGYVNDETFSAFLHQCRAVVFPSLYEGFGIPVLEAMAAGKPVLCSNDTSLAEIAASGACLLDPRRPDAWAGALERLSTDDTWLAELACRATRRAQDFGGTDDYAAACLDVLERVMAGEPA